jgi:hypothetical protein
MNLAPRISLRINKVLASLAFHRKITAVPFTAVRACGKQASTSVI